MEAYERILKSHEEHKTTLPSQDALRHARSALSSPSSSDFLESHDPADTISHITRDILPALTGQARSSRYLGFVIGGILPIAEWADNVASSVDQNAMVHLPGQSASTHVELAALEMMLRVLRLESGEWRGRTLTTGATGSNILGLACAREHIIASRAGGVSVGEVGLLKACRLAGVEGVQVLTSQGHSSVAKAASVLGLGREAMKEVSVGGETPWKLDLEALEKELQTPGMVSIIAVGVGEVNTGRYTVAGIEEWKKLRALADRYGAWIHADGAFGIFARALERTEEFETLHKRVEGVELADSITVDGHKLLNVPYDCGIFFTKSPDILSSVFANPNASYLTPGDVNTPSPLNIGLENSRRFRALPFYAVLHSLGRPGVAAMIARMVRLTRRITAFFRSSEHYELLPGGDDLDEDHEIFIIAIFRARDREVNDKLVDNINRTRELYVSGTSWGGEKAARIAVANWKFDLEKDFEVITAILTAVAEGREFDLSAMKKQSE